MLIRILHLVEGAEQATGVAVIIDVFRAFSTACYVFANGARTLIPVGDLELAYELKKAHADYVLMGERNERMQAGFDHGNSPTQIETVSFAGRTVIQTTSAGTQGIARARKADQILTGSFVNAQAIVDYIRRAQPQQVSLVAMGTSGTRRSDEDTLCAEYLRNALEGKSNEFDSIVRRLRNCESAAKFFDPAKDWAPERDFELCLQLNRFSFVLRAEPWDNDLMCLRKIAPA
jgi:2-phosphosulfolactate phosphatase